MWTRTLGGFRNEMMDACPGNGPLQVPIPSQEQEIILPSHFPMNQLLKAIVVLAILYEKEYSNFPAQGACILGRG